MILKKFKKLGLIAVLSSALMFTACTPEEEALASGVAVGAVAGDDVSSYNDPHEYNQPYSPAPDNI